VSTKQCFIHSTNENKETKLSETEFREGWVTGTPTCSAASYKVESCPRETSAATASLVNNKPNVCETCSSWEWTSCTASCGGGTKQQVRNCGDQGEDDSDICQCRTEKDQDTPCNTDPCPVDGVWAEWSSYSACSSADTHSCGTKYRARSCSNPPPSNGGQPCQGREKESEPCSGGKKLPLKLVGHCKERNGNNTNKGQTQLEACFLSPEGCLDSCEKYKGYTGCEYQTVTKLCYVHTAHINGVNSADDKQICWLFIVDELPGKCVNNGIQIGTNLTSENCLKSCQEVENAEGCQYNISNKKCEFFTSSGMRADNDINHTCWTFNKGTFHDRDQRHERRRFQSPTKKHRWFQN